MNAPTIHSGDRDRDYDPLDEIDEQDALEAAAEIALCAGCGHFLPLAPDGYCGQCEPPVGTGLLLGPALSRDKADHPECPSSTLKPITVHVQLPKRIDENEVA